MFRRRGVVGRGFNLILVNRVDIPFSMMWREEWRIEGQWRLDGGCLKTLKKSWWGRNRNVKLIEPFFSLCNRTKSGRIVWEFVFPKFSKGQWLATRCSVPLGIVCRTFAKREYCEVDDSLLIAHFYYFLGHLQHFLAASWMSEVK